MWPKALTQLIELAPHLSRLVPMADRFLQSKSAGEEANRRAMDAMTEGLRGDLGQVTASHAGLYRQLNEANEKLATVSADARSARQAAEALEFRLNHTEARLKRLTILGATSLGILLLCAVLLVLLVIRPH